MERKIGYKVVALSYCDPAGTLYSMTYEHNPMAVSYEVGKITKPKFGALTCFDNLDYAIKMANRNWDRKIFKCWYTDSKTKYRGLIEIGTITKKDAIQCAKYGWAPEGTVFASSIELIEEISVKER